MTAYSKRVITEIPKDMNIPILQEKTIANIWTDKFPVWQGLIGREQPGIGYYRKDKYVYRKPSPDLTTWRSFEDLGKLKFIDVATQSIPSMVFKNRYGDFGFLTLDHFRTAVKMGKWDLTDGMLSGIFRLVQYKSHGYEKYLELVLT